MLREWRFERTTEPEEVHKAELKQRRADLAGLQQRLKQAGLPVIVLVEGWGAAGKGSVIRSLIRELDPRFFKVISVSMPTEEERRWRPHPESCGRQLGHRKGAVPQARGAGLACRRPKTPVPQCLLPLHPVRNNAKE